MYKRMVYSVGGLSRTRQRIFKKDRFMGRLGSYFEKLKKDVQVQLGCMCVCVGGGGCFV